jgi:hypothetical protein
MSQIYFWYREQSPVRWQYVKFEFGGNMYVGVMFYLLFHWSHVLSTVSFMFYLLLSLVLCIIDFQFYVSWTSKSESFWTCIGVRSVFGTMGRVLRVLLDGNMSCSEPNGNLSCCTVSVLFYLLLSYVLSAVVVLFNLLLVILFSYPTSPVLCIVGVMFLCDCAIMKIFWSYFSCYVK